MRVGIVGAGSLGSLLAAYLALNGEDVSIYDVDAGLVAGVEEDGIHAVLDGETHVVTPAATTEPDDVGVVDVVFVCVKAMHTESAVRDADPMVGPETVLVTLQNGLMNLDVIEAEYPDNSVVGGTTLLGAQRDERGRVVQTSQGETKLGGDDSVAVERTVSLLSAAGLVATAVEHPRTHIWNKQVATVGTKPIAALTGLRDGPLGEFGPTASLMENLVREAERVATELGIEITGDPVEAAYDICREHYDTKPSMLEDVENERRTEIDHINGAIVDYGDEVGVETPYNEAVTALVKGREHGYRVAE